MRDETMAPPDSVPRSTSRSFVAFLRVIGVLALLLIAAIAALAVLDVLPDKVLAGLTMRIVIVAGIAAAAIGALTVPPPRGRS
jgi:hypothetical protein